MSESGRIVQKLWSYCQVLRDDGLSYQDYLEQLTFLLFLKMADERADLTGEQQPIPAGHRWADLSAPEMEGVKLEQHYRDTLKTLTSPEAVGVCGRAAGPEEKDPVLCGKRVLLADDEEMIRETVRDVLTNHGCVVHAVDDGAAAIEAIKSQPFDLVLSDIKMPNKTGYEVFAAAKEVNPNFGQPVNRTEEERRILFGQTAAVVR